MHSDLTRGIFGAFAAFALAGATMPLAKRLGQALGSTAIPAIARPWATRTPATGGVSIMFAIFAALAMTGNLPGWIALGAGALFAVGFIDDVKVLKPRQKFACQLAIVTGAAIFWLPRYAFTSSPILNLVITVFWLAATTNAFNLIDGLDGLAAGVGIVSALTIAVVGYMQGVSGLALPALIVSSSLAGFLLYNFSPASIIMGDGGALPLGYLLGVLALEGGRIATNWRSTIWVFPVLVMLVPLLDTLTVMITRTTTGKSISWRGLDHVHDRLLGLGLSARAVVTATWVITTIAAVCAFATTRLSREELVVALPLIALVAAVLALFTIDLTFDGTAPESASESLPRLQRLVLSLSYKRRVAEAAMDLLLITAAYCWAVTLRLDFNLNQQVIASILIGLPWVVALTYPAFVLTGIYRGIWRHVGLSDLVRFTSGGALAGLLIALCSMVLPIRHSGSIAVLYAMLLANLMVATRSSFVLLRKFINGLAAVKDRVLVVGSGTLGAMAANFVLQTRSRSARLIGFVDSDAFRRGKLIEGWPVFGPPEELDQIYRRNAFTEILIAKEDIPIAQLETIYRFSAELGLTVRSFAMQVKDLDTATRGSIGGGRRAA